MADVQQEEPYRLAGPEAMEAWRQGAPAAPAIADLAPPAEDKSMGGLVSSLTALRRQKVAQDTRL